MISEEKKLDKIKGCLVGMAIGDAIGVHLEFKPYGKYDIKGFVEDNPYQIPMGHWTDDTSMALCIAESLIKYKGFNGYDQVMNYIEWYTNGYMSSTGKCFDIGGTIKQALDYHMSQTFHVGWDLVDYTNHSLGNGCIMRLAPIPLFFHDDIISAIFYAGESSKTTHTNQRCVDSCRLLSEIIFYYLNNDHTESKFSTIQNKLHPSVMQLANNEFVADEDIRGVGHVIMTLEAALWAVERTSNFRDAILKVVNLGEDADTTGAVCGMIAGAKYGYSSIPQEWKDQLFKEEMIVNYSEKLYNKQK